MLEAGGHQVVGEAVNGATALALARERDPDIVLLDILLPDTTGFDVAEELARNGSRPAVVLTSSRSRTDYASRLAASPARGFIPKSDLSPDALAELLG